MSTAEREAAEQAVSFNTSYTLFPNPEAKDLKFVRGAPWDDLVAKVRTSNIVHHSKAACPLISMCEYGNERSKKGCLRRGKNVLRVFGIELDYDLEAMTLEQGAQKFRDARVCALLYTSPSHKPDAPRWRALLPLSAPVDPKTRRMLVGRANLILGGVVARESFSLSQSFYIGRVRGAVYETAEVEGDFIDRASGIPPLYPDDATERAESSARAEFMAKGDDDGYNTMRSLAMTWALKRWDQKAIERELNALLDERGTNDPVLRSRVEPLAGSAVNKAQEKLGEEVIIGPSDDDLALRFAEAHGHDLRYVAMWKKWLIYDGVRWARDEKLRVFDMSRELLRQVREELTPDLKPLQRQQLRKRLGSSATIWDIVKLAGTDPRIAVSHEQLDSDIWALNTPAGVVDLRSGTMRPHDPAELHTKCTAVAPSGECPLFHKVFEHAVPDALEREYLQRAFGYALTGSVREHAFLFLFGEGRNGKGTLVYAVLRAIADYGLVIPAELLMETHHDRHPTELAQLDGARMVVGSEVPKGRRWNEARVKLLTGGDPINARGMCKDPYVFDPTHTLFIMGNSKPGLRTVDVAIRRRTHLMPFKVTVTREEEDPSLPEKLEAEYAGILRWAIDGCVVWQTQGLRPPQSIRDVTSAYMDKEDHVSLWFSECVQITPHGRATLRELQESHNSWCTAAGEAALRRSDLTEYLDSNGIKRESSRLVTYVGIKLFNRDGRREICNA